jgi:phospholipid N-methyltransferase
MDERRREHFVREHLLLVSRFVRNPRGVGAIAPSSQALAEAMVSSIDFGRPKIVAELGAGLGAFTGHLHSRLVAGSRLIAVEIDPVFVRELRRRWPEVDVAHAPAEDLPQLLANRGIEAVDHVVSGLPFVSLPTPVVERTLQAVATMLRPGGTFTTFQYAHGFSLPSALASRRLMARCLGSDRPRTHIVIRNIPPAVVLTWRRAHTDD